MNGLRGRARGRAAGDHRRAGPLHLGLCRLWLCWHLLVLATRRRSERGDVPGWVLVTVMSVGLVVAIWGVAKGELTSMLRSALNSVK